MDEQQIIELIAEAQGTASAALAIQQATLTFLANGGALSTDQIRVILGVAQAAVSASSALSEEAREIAAASVRGFAQAFATLEAPN